MQKGAQPTKRAHQKEDLQNVAFPLSVPFLPTRTGEMKSVYWLCVLMISNFLFNINIGVFGRFLHHSLPPHSATFYSPSFSKSHSLFDQKPKNEKKNESRETNKTNKKKTKTKNKTTVFALTALSAYDGPVNRAPLLSFLSTAAGPGARGAP